jgi:hypothetical protein
MGFRSDLVLRFRFYAGSLGKVVKFAIIANEAHVESGVENE